MSLWQTQSWQEMLLKSGQTQEYFIIELDVASSSLNQGRIEMGGEKVKTKIFVEKRRVSFGQYGLFVIGLDAAASPLAGENGERCCVEEGELIKRLTEHLKELCIEENCLFAQIETLDYSLQPAPFSLGGKVGIGGEERENISSFQKSKYYKKFIPPYTAVIDLTQSEEQILAAMKPKGRYNIKVAQKNRVQVKQVWKTPENIEKFYALMKETMSRDNFSGNTLVYYQQFLKQENAQLFFAEHEDKLIAAGIFIQYEDSMYYYYGASANYKRNLMAPYLLQWMVVQHAKETGCRLYDFLGIANPEETDSSLVGVTDFKLKLTPDTRKVSESLLYIHKKWKYTAIQVLKKVRKK